MKAHWDVMASIDFTTVEIWTKGGLTTFYLLFVMELKPDASSSRAAPPIRTKTITLELTNHEDGFLKDKKYLIMDRDATFSKSFRTCLRREGVKPVRLPPRSPNLNAHLERFLGSLVDLFSSLFGRSSPTYWRPIVDAIDGLCPA